MQLNHTRVQKHIFEHLDRLTNQLEGDCLTDVVHQILYSTDASAYREKPLAIVRPKSKEDIQKVVHFAREHGISIIPRAAGTSLAGQVVGSGLVLDLSRYMKQIIELNVEEKWVRVQPGVVLDELNLFLKPSGLFFGPETSTSNRCNIGGMVGNNSCGAHSLVYGSTREHTISVEAILSDGSEVLFAPVDVPQFEDKCQLESLEGELYRNIKYMLEDEENAREIRTQFPDPRVKRRNTGYAIDMLLESKPFTPNGELFNFSQLICGSEGTLAIVTEIKLNLVPLPPAEKAVICMHLVSVQQALEANLIALKYAPEAIELMDRVILDCTKDNITQRKNRFFVEGDPGALLIIEFARDTRDEILDIHKRMELEMRTAGYGYHFPLLFGKDISRVWALRKAGLGVLSNIPGDAKPVSVIEDTAIHPSQLPGYIDEFNQLLIKYGLSCVYHAHIATGELHLRPVINLKDPDGVRLFRKIAHGTALLVKKYRGSLSGEHGDGRLRGEFIPLMIGDKNYNLLRQLKMCWDPQGVFNAGKITDTPPMDTSLRYVPGRKEREFRTWFDFSSQGGVLRAAENCNGSGDCRKSHLMGGTMCPSYMASGEEKTTTRARANILRDYLTYSGKANPFDHHEIKEVMDLCLSCKGCKSECPSSVDIAKLKAEFLQHYYENNGIPFRTRLIASFNQLNKLASVAPGIYNFLVTNKWTANLIKRMAGFATARSLPKLYKTTLSSWLDKNLPSLNGQIAEPLGTVWLFIDEFTEFNDTLVGVSTVGLLSRMGYKIKVARHTESGRALLSKGMLAKARKRADKNVMVFHDKVSDLEPLVGIEPSCILSFRDEYPELVSHDLRTKASNLAKNCLLIDEFIAREMEKGVIRKEWFTLEPKRVKLHGHCHQKAIASTVPSLAMLSFPANYSVEEIPSGCCGMAGSFGYEKEHHELSMKVGELVLFPSVRKLTPEILVAAPGTSCRHQIKDGTGREAFHPVEILANALVK
jgi:FAD/FMN-containing dehydrogenase/Fe-S oxidoreductase